MKLDPLLPSLYLFLVCMCSNVVGAQTQTYLNATGNPSFGVNFPIENGFVDVSNGNMHMEFPLATHTQRGALNLNERLVYDSRIWMIGNYNNYYWWPNNIPNVPNTQAGWRFVTGAETGAMSYTPLTQQNNGCGTPGGDGEDGFDYISTSKMIWTDPAGTSHTFDASIWAEDTNCSGTETFQQSVTGGYAADGTGYQVAGDPNGNPVVLDPTATQVFPQVIDRFGNTWIFDSQNNLVDDLGRTPVLVTKSGNVTYYDVLAANGPINNQGTRVRYTVTTAPIFVKTFFAQLGVQDWSGNLSPVQSIALPDGSAYTFSYDIYGGIKSVALPTGGVISYGWTNFFDSAGDMNRWLASRQLGSDPATTFTPAVVTRCQNYGTGCQETVTLHRPSSDETVYTLTLNNGAWNVNTASYTGSSTSGSPLVQIANTYDFSHQCQSLACSGAEYIQQSNSVTTLPQAGLQYQSQQFYNNPASGQVTAVKLWDYYLTGSVPSTIPAREVDTSYTGLDVHQVTVLDSSGNPAGQTTYGYTTSATPTTGIVNHGTANAGGPYLQSVSHWLNTGGSLTSTYAMDDTGTPVSSKDPEGNQTNFSFQCSEGYPAQITNALLQPTTFHYDCSSGQILWSKDPNDIAANRSGTVYAYESGAGRLSSVTYPDGGRTSLSYASPTEVDTIVSALPDTGRFAQDFADIYGRSYQHVAGNISSETTYDASGRVNCVTNPHLVSAVSPTDGTTCITSYDGLNRPLFQTQSDSVSQLSWTYWGNVLTYTNESGAIWQRTTNALGQLTQVLEPTSFRSAPSIETDYGYDGLGNATSILQKGAPGSSPVARAFGYDSLSRLVSSSNPEQQGSISYTYDQNGNVYTKTSPLPNKGALRGLNQQSVTATYLYDTLNRLSHVTYTDGTPGMDYSYDSAPNVWGQTLTNGIGRVTWSQKSDTYEQSIYGYDPMGRLTTQEICLPSNCWRSGYSLSAVYDAAGALTDLTYPDGHRIHQTWDFMGQLSSSNLANIGATAVNQSYFQVLGYLPDSSPQLLTLGNGVQVGTIKNNRLEVGGILAFGSQAPLNQTTFFSHTYCYVNCLSGGTANTGNIWQIADSLKSANTQDFTHDAQNRITQFNLGGMPNQSFQTDSFGNMTPLGPGGPVNLFAPSTNRISNLQCVGPAPAGLQYDAAGNQLCDGSGSMGSLHQYVFDGENRISSVSNGTSTTGYVYDSDGNRVRKNNPDGTWTEYVYFGGQPVMEQHSDSTWTDYVYANGGKIAKVDSVQKYLHVSGTGCSPTWNLPINNVQLTSGAKFSWREKHDGGAQSLLIIQFSDNSWAAPSWSLQNGSQGPDDTWENVTIDLSSFAGKYIWGMWFQENQVTGSGTINGYILDMALQNGDGTVIPFYNQESSVPGYNTVSGCSNGQIVAEQLASGSDTTSQINSTHYLTGDHLATTQMEFSGGGWPVWQGQFTPFGQELDTQFSNNKYRYTGLEQDQESGLDHAMFRQYSPGAGRWMSPDPYNGSFDPSNPQSLNRYAYVNNGPLNSSDPSGLEGGIGGSPIGGCIGAVLQGGLDVPADAMCAAGLALNWLEGLFNKPKFSGTEVSRPNQHPWQENNMMFYRTDIMGALGVPSQGCEFGACGDSFASQGDQPCGADNKDVCGSDAVGDFIGLGFKAVWGGIAGVGKVAGCGLVGLGKGTQSFFGIYPPTVNNGPPGPSTVLRAANGAYKIGAPGMIYRLSRLGPVGRVAGDLIPGVGEALMYAQTGLAINDGGRAAYDCASKIQ